MRVWQTIPTNSPLCSLGLLTSQFTLICPILLSVLAPLARKLYQQVSITVALLEFATCLFKRTASFIYYYLTNVTWFLRVFGRCACRVRYQFYRLYFLSTQCADRVQLNFAILRQNANRPKEALVLQSARLREKTMLYCKMVFHFPMLRYQCGNAINSISYLKIKLLQLFFMLKVGCLRYCFHVFLIING